MQAQELFYIVATIALALLSLFLIMLAIVVLSLNRLARNTLQAISYALKDMEYSVESFAKNWSRGKFISGIYWIIKTAVRRII